MNSLQDVGARAKALRQEIDALKARALSEERDLTSAEVERLESIKSEAVLLKVRADEYAADERRRRDLDAIAKGVDVSDDHNTKARSTAAMGWDGSQLKALHSAIVERRPLAIQAKTVATTDAPQSTVPSYRLTDFPYLRDRMRVLDVIPAEPTTATTVNYFRALTAASAATSVAEGALKPESTPQWESVSTAVRKIGHWARAN